MGPTCGYDKALTLATIDEIKGQLQTAKTSLDAPATFGVSNPVTFDFSKLFAGLDLRSMAPDYTGEVPGMLPDPTFAGLLPDTTQINLNQDLDGDGHPDLLYRHYTNFFDGFLDGSVYGCTNMILTGWSSDINWDLTFDTANHSFTFGWSNYLGSGTETGFYEIQQDGSLLLTNDNQNSTVFEKIEIKIHPEWGPKTYAPQYGIEATLTKTANLSQTVETVWIEYGPYLGTP
ncbi:MAG: hypothetical protein D6706_05090 [Chloroflexi bacterium]|nr:MAG: hypothetical protein D6706_05090 [Chloroflexota bacterium]